MTLFEVTLSGGTYLLYATSVEQAAWAALELAGQHQQQLLNVRRKIKGHVLVSTGLMDQVLIHPRETFRAAVIASAHSVILMHNHPSGDSNPSEADIRVTRELIRAGQVLKIEVLDHVIVGRENHRSLRELGYFS